MSQGRRLTMKLSLCRRLSTPSRESGMGSSVTTCTTPPTRVASSLCAPAPSVLTARCIVRNQGRRLSELLCDDGRRVGLHELLYRTGHSA
jgi:hypothetical protein